MNLQFIEARDLPDAWFQTLYKLLDEGRVWTIDRGSYAGQQRLEFDWITIYVKFPSTRPLLPQIESHYNIPNPVTDDYLNDYLPYLMTEQLKPGEAYTYGSRLTFSPLLNLRSVAYKTPEHRDTYIQEEEIYNNEKILPQKSLQFFLNQIELLIWTYKKKGHRNNQMILQVGQPTDMLLQDPPCLRHIDTRIQDGKLHFYPYFRSWDMWGGFPANLAAIQLLKEYCAMEIGVENGELIATSKGLHIYGYAFELAKRLRMREDMELKQGTNNKIE